MTSCFLLVAFVPLIMVIVVIYNQRVHSIREEAFNKLIAIRDLKVNEVNTWLHERIGDIQTISEDFEIRNLEETIYKIERPQKDIKNIINVRNHLSRYLKNYREYHEIFIIDPIFGIIEISTDKSKEGKDRSKDPYFTRPMQTR